MKIYDITQELFSAHVYPGDKKPAFRRVSDMEEGALCNITEFEMNAHNGTHVDAPLYFIDGAKSIDRVDPDRFIGYAYVAAHEGDILAADAERILEKAAAFSVSVHAGASLRTVRTSITKDSLLTLE